MKPTTIKRIMGFLMSALGVVMVFVALNAETFGFERGAGWGPPRRFLLAVGISIILAPHSRHLLAAPLATLERTLNQIARNGRRDGAPSLFEPRAGVRRRADFAWAVVIPFILGLTALTWIISVGRWTAWPGSTNYFHLLADGFRAGKTHLLVEPHPDLLALEDPYPFENRESTPHLWDVSLF